MMDIKDCEQAKAGDCCYCKNMAYKNLEQCLDKIEEICIECHKHDYDLCCTCKYADNCRADDEYTSYDVANYIHSIIKQAKEGGE